MKHPERITPIAAVTSALATLACCLPFGFAAFAATATLTAVFARFSLWFLVASVVLLVLAFAQVYRPSACERRTRTSLVILWTCAAVVFLVIVFPQVVATALAGIGR